MTHRVVRIVVQSCLLLCGSAALAGHYTLPLFVTSTASGAATGVVRVLNVTAQSGPVEIHAIDDAGTRTGPASFTLGAFAAAEFTASDLTSGNAMKGLTGSLGSLSGDVRLEIDTDLEIVPAAYVRAADGTLSAMHDTVRASAASEEAYEYLVPIFNPASEMTQGSRLRLINPGDEAASITIEGRDDNGTEATGGTVELTLAAGAAQTLTAQQLEAGDTGLINLTGRLGAGVGKWRLSVSSDRPIRVLNAVWSTSGYVNNLSTTTVAGTGSVAGDDGDGDGADPVTPTYGADEALPGVPTSGIFAPSTLSGGASVTATADGTTIALDDGAWFELGDGTRYTCTSAVGCAVTNGTVTRGTVTGTSPGADMPETGSLGVCRVGMLVTIEQSCTYPGTDDAFSVNVRGRGRFLDRLAGIRIRIDNETIDERVYDFAASHQGDGVWRIDRIAGSTEPPPGGGMEPPDTDGDTGAMGQDPSDTSRFDHATAFPRLPADTFHFADALLVHSWYVSNYNLAKYSGYQELLTKHDRHLPAGRGLTILQAERGHTPDDMGDVVHLFANPESDSHARTVAEFLTSPSTYPLLYTSYTTFSPYLDSFHASTTGDLRTFLSTLAGGSWYPATSHDGSAVTPAKLLNISNTNGSGTDVIRRFDKFVEENDMLACTAIRGALGGNLTTSGNAYNSLVVGPILGIPDNFAGALANDHGGPRYKPDIVTRSTVGHSTPSWATPVVCSAAAVLLERAQADPAVAAAYNSVATKAILMAGATRFDYRISAHWSTVQAIDPESELHQPLFSYGEWARTSDTLPMDPRYGAGSLNVLGAYDILDAGEFEAGNTRWVGVPGWDHAGMLAVGDELDYPFSLERESMFSAVLVWHRYVDDAIQSHLPDYELSVYDAGGARVAHSDSSANNVELVESRLPAGGYVMKVRVKSDGGSTDELSYGLAWTAKEVLARPANVGVSASAEHWRVSWDEQSDHKYRVRVARDAGFTDIDRDVYVDGTGYPHEIPADGTPRHFRVYAYPSDGKVAYEYPSAPVTIRSPANP